MENENDYLDDIDYFAQASLYNNKVLLSVGGGEYGCQMDVLLDRDYVINLIDDLQIAVNKLDL